MAGCTMKLDALLVRYYQLGLFCISKFNLLLPTRFIQHNEMSPSPVQYLNLSTASLVLGNFLNQRYGFITSFWISDAPSNELGPPVSSNIANSSAPLLACMTKSCMHCRRRCLKIEEVYVKILFKLPNNGIVYRYSRVFNLKVTCKRYLN